MTKEEKEFMKVQKEFKELTKWWQTDGIKYQQPTQKKITQTGGVRKLSKEEENELCERLLAKAAPKKRGRKKKYE